MTSETTNPITATVFTENTDDEDRIVCLYPHPEAPVEVRGGGGDDEEMSAEEIALRDGWLNTDDGWICPSSAHSEAQVMLYEVTPGPDDLNSAWCMNGDDALEAIGWLMAEMPDTGESTISVTIKRSPTMVGKAREMFADDDEESED